MKQYLKMDPWLIIEDGFEPDYNRVSESIFSLGNGYMGGRGNFEEEYSGDSLQGNYMAGVYYPDKTRVGWWKNGYPEYFAKVLNGTNWIGINVKIGGTHLDIAKCNVSDFRRILNMKDGYLERSFVCQLKDGKKVAIKAIRFISVKRKEIGAISYSVTPLNFSGNIEFTPYLDADVVNEDSNYDEKFWQEVSKESLPNRASITVKTKKLDFHVCSYMKYDILQNGKKISYKSETHSSDKYVDNVISVTCTMGETTTLCKYVANVTSRDYTVDSLKAHCGSLLNDAYECGFEDLLKEHAQVWNEKWNNSDIIIQGDVAAQQAIRFNIFSLNQTYSGEDDRLNIGPKGFTGEKYGGSTYWDTEAYCVPFYLSTAPREISKNLLMYRFNHLVNAKKNARKLGFSKGALYPMVTMNGEECHNEWEITFEEIHRNGAIAYAIFNYTNYTGDKSYLEDYGIDVLVEISRFWEQRVNYVADKDVYMILGVTGPNEYENNVNNNWYTNTMASFTMEYAIESLKYLQKNKLDKYSSAINRLDLKPEEVEKWKDIIDKMYYPKDKKLGIFLQQDGYLDKEQILANDLPESERPINQNWSWDRILRSCLIKQADVLQGLYFFSDKFDYDTKKRNFDFYEPRTVHESSLSPCVHCILASELGYTDKSYEMYLRTSRLDLDNYNNDTSDGCHITSQAGTWMSIVHGFGGMRVKENTLILNPIIPKEWDSYSFKILFRNALLTVAIDKNEVKIAKQKGPSVNLKIYGVDYTFTSTDSLVINR